MRLFGDGYEGSIEENGTYSAVGVWWDCSWRSVELFSGEGGVAMVDGGSGVHIDHRPNRQSRNRSIRSKISRYILDRGRVEFGENVTLTGSKWALNNYITRFHREFKLLGVSLLEFEAVRTNSWQRIWALGTPGWAAQQNEKELLLKTDELGVNMLQSVQSPTHLSHRTLSQLFLSNTIHHTNTSFTTKKLHTPSRTIPPYTHRTVSTIFLNWTFISISKQPHHLLI